MDFHLPFERWRHNILYIVNIVLIMVAPRNRADHYIFVLWFLSSSFFFLLLFSSPNLSGRRLDVYTILLQMVWPLCEFRMQVWNVLHVARWKCRTEKIAKNWPSGHHGTTLSGYIFATKDVSTIGKKSVKQQYLPHMSSQYGKLRPTSGWDLFVRLGLLS